MRCPGRPVIPNRSPINRHSGKRAIKEGKRTIKANGLFSGALPWWKTAPLRRPIKRSMSLYEKTGLTRSKSHSQIASDLHCGAPTAISTPPHPLQRRGSNQKILVSVIFLSAILGPEMGASIYGRQEKCVLSAGKTHVHRIPRFGGGVYFGFWGGECRLYFYGRADFSDQRKGFAIQITNCHPLTFFSVLCLVSGRKHHCQSLESKRKRVKRVNQKARKSNQAMGNVSETRTPTTCLKSTAVHLQLVRQYARHLYRRTFLASKLRRKGIPAVRLPFVLQYGG